MDIRSKQNVINSPISQGMCIRSSIGLTYLRCSNFPGFNCHEFINIIIFILCIKGSTMYFATANFGWYLYLVVNSW